MSRDPVAPPPPREAQPGTAWASGSVTAAIRQVAFVAAAAWQLVMVLVTLASVGGAGWGLAVAQGVVAVLAIVALRRPMPAYLVPGLAAALGTCGYLVSRDIDSALSFAACWQINFASCIALLLIARRAVIVAVVGQALLTALAILTVLPEWGPQMPFSIAVTQVSIVVVMRLGLPRLMRVSAEADAAAGAADAAELRLRVSALLGTRIAEETRTLHDTAINTLGAVANGTAGIVEGGQVRDQCARDVVLLETMRDDRSAPRTLALRDIFALPGLPIVRGGAEDAELDRAAARLSEEATAGIVGCVREALTNAAKHSGAELVAIDATVGGAELVIRVEDRGRGFAGPSPGDRGIATSIRARARDHGLVAEVDSAPGRGTRVEITAPFAPVRDPAPEMARTDAEVHEVSARLLRRAGLLWGMGVTVVSVLLTATGSANVGNALLPMIVLMLAAWAAAWGGTRGRPGSRLLGSTAGRALLASVLALCTLTVFVLSAAATGFGGLGAVYWQALAPTGPLVMLLALRPGRKVAVAAMTAWALLVLALAAFVAPNATAAQIVVIAGIVGVGFSAVWGRFQTLLVARAERGFRDRARALDARIAVDAAAAARTSYLRWLDAGLDSAIELLRGIAEGSRGVAAAATRAACAEEEQYLRQLVQISPEFVRLGRGLMAALREARDRGVPLVLRAGGPDAPDAATAEDVSGVLLSAIRGTPPGEALHVSLFPVGSGMQLTVSGASLEAPAALAAGRGSSRFERLGSVALLELTYTGEERSSDPEPREVPHERSRSVPRLPRRGRRGSPAAAGAD
ncbi:ATP-binding protein [Leucobacter allii]|uniref:ATP-binding protein n=1 Tax=Leucobacter allii TaxID=2932247 RepID=A0ABY4FM07_9MICO|nr:ATP-binding protein [Leucobacter allii]UOQ57326.1 ATP-binding protein [Leucobacter allii]